MKSKAIKENIDKFFKTIEECNLAIAELQKNCAHESTFKGTYSWRIGVMEERDICVDCQLPLPKTHNEHLFHSEVKYSQICTNCVNTVCNCTFKNETVNQYFGK